MMSAKRLLDAVAVFNATRTVAYNHFNIRRSQFDLYARTSSITRGINRAGRSGNDVSNAANYLRQSATGAANANPNSSPETPEPEAVEGEEQSVKRTEGIGQDHHYERSQENSVANSVPKQDLEVQQDKAKNDPLADGMIPSRHHRLIQTVTDEQDLSLEEAMKLQQQSEAEIPSQTARQPIAEYFSTTTEGPEFGVEQEQDVFHQPSDSAAPVLSALPRFKIPKTEEDVLGGDPHIPQKINGDVFYSSRQLPQDVLANQITQEDLSEEMISSLFRSPRVARLLSTKSTNTPGGIRARGSRMYATSRPPFAQGKADISEARVGGSQTGKGSEPDAETLKILATDLSRDAEMESAVSTPRYTP
jgi:aarF domain-containing kinase